MWTLLIFWPTRQRTTGEPLCSGASRWFTNYAAGPCCRRSETSTPNSSPAPSPRPIGATSSVCACYRSHDKIRARLSRRRGRPYVKYSRCYTSANARVHISSFPAKISIMRVTPLISACIVILGASMLSGAPTPGKPKPLNIQRYAAQGPLRFEPNVGQADAGVHFVARGAGYSLSLADDGLAMSPGAQNIFRIHPTHAQPTL